MSIKLNIPLPNKGFVVDRPGEYIDARSASALKNHDYNRGIIRKRAGSATLGATLSERIQRYFELQIGNETRLFRVGITKVEVLNKSTSTWSSVAHAALTGTAEDPVSYTFALISAAKYAIYTNGIDRIRKCTISGNDSVLGDLTNIRAKYVVNFGDYVLLLNVIDTGTQHYARVQWCDTGNPESWTAGAGSNAGSVDLLEDPDDITGGGVFGNFVTVHKQSGIYLGQLVSTSAVFRFDRRATGVGAVAGATIQNIPSGEQIFLASDGIHLFNGMTAPLIDSPVQDELREEMNPLYANKSQSIYVKELDEYWVCVATGSDTEPQTVYRYNWRTKQMYKDTRANLTAMGIFLNTTEKTWDDSNTSWDDNPDRWSSVTNLSNNPIVIFGDSAGISSRRTTSTYDDVGVAVTANIDTKEFTAEDAGLPDIDRIMRWKGLEVWAKGSAVSVYYSTDEGGSWTLLTTLTLSSSYPSDSSPLKVWMDVKSSKIRFRFYNATSEQGYTLKKYQIIATPAGARK